MTYIYLITYTDGSLYVGSHTWNGSEGQLDPNYHGSSGVAEHFKLQIASEEILEVVSEERKLIAEREWIERYATLHGLSDKALSLTYHHKDNWRKKFKSGGRVINLHANDAVAAREANRRKMLEEGFTDKQKRASSQSIRIAQRTSVEYVKKNGPTQKQKESSLRNQRRSVELLKINGPSLKRQEASRKAIVKAREGSCRKFKEEGQTPRQREASLSAIKCAQAAALSKFKEEGPTDLQKATYISNNRKRTEKAHTPKAMENMVNRRKANNSYVLGAEKAKTTTALNRAKDPSYGRTRIVKVSIEGTEFIGSVKRVCADIEHPNWSCTVSKKFKVTGKDSVIHNGVLFETVSY